MVVSNRKALVSRKKAGTSKGQKEKKGSNLGHPKKLLLVSEPKIQSHHEKGESWSPLSPLFHTGIQVPSSRCFNWKRRRGEPQGTLFSPAA